MGSKTDIRSVRESRTESVRDSRDDPDAFVRPSLFFCHSHTNTKKEHTQTHRSTQPSRPPSHTDGNPARVSVCMARRRQSVNNRVESDLAQLKQPIAEQHNRSGTPHCELNEANSPIFVPSTRNWSDHTQPLDIQGTSTAISIPPASSSTDEEPRDVPTSLPKKTGKVSPPPFARGWLGKGAAKASLPSNKDARTSKRSDSVALSQAEGGSFLPDMNGIDVSRSGPHARSGPCGGPRTRVARTLQDRCSGRGRRARR